MKKILLSTLSLCVLAAAGTASAQQAAPAPAAAPVNLGPAMPGVCIYSSERAIGTSDVGKAVGARMEALQKTVEAELQSEGTAIETERKSLEASAATLAKADLEKRALALRQRMEAFQTKAQLRSQELDVTERQQLGKILENLNPLVQATYAEKGCGLLLNREVVMLANPAMDITDIAVTKLNAKIKTLAFDRVRLDQKPAAPAAPAAAPAKQ
jgi:Skp family chaperone for outer membrane proteins